MSQENVALCGWGTRRFHIILMLLLFMSGAFCLSPAQAAGLMDIYRQAQKNDPTIQSVYFQNMAIKEGRRQAIAQLLPTLAGSYEYKQTTQDIKSSDNTVFGSGETDFDTTSYSLTLTQPILHWESIVGLKQSKSENLRADAELALAKQELIVRVADLYLKTLAAQDFLEFANAEQTAIEKHFELASGRHEMGLIPITDLHDAKSRMATTQAKTIEAQNLLDDALQALQEVTGEAATPLKPLNAEASLVIPGPNDLDSWVQGALRQNPAIALQRYAIEIADQEIRRHRTGHYPTIDLVGRYNRNRTDGTLFGGGSDVETTDIMLQVNLPIYQGGMVNSRIREARYKLGAARQELSRQERSVKRQTRSAYLGVNSNLGRVDALMQSVVSNQLALEVKQEGFLSGLYTSLNVLDAERDLSLVSIDYAQARYDYILNSLKLKQAVGTLNDQDLEELDRWFN